jgi:hypothetical protein
VDGDGEGLDERPELQRHGGVEQQHVAGGHHHVVREGGGAVLGHADDLLAGGVLLAAAELLGLLRRHDDGVERRRGAERQRRGVHALAERGDRARGLVAHDLARHAPAVLAGEAVEVGAADAGRADPQQHLARSGLGALDLDEVELVEVGQDECSHGGSWAVGRRGRDIGCPRARRRRGAALHARSSTLSAARPRTGPHTIRLPGIQYPERGEQLYVAS